MSLTEDDEDGDDENCGPELFEARDDDGFELLEAREDDGFGMPEFEVIGVCD